MHPAFLTWSDCRTPTYKNIFGFKTSTSVNRQATKSAKKLRDTEVPKTAFVTLAALNWLQKPGQSSQSGRLK